LTLGPGHTSADQITFNTALNYLRRNPEAADIINNSHFSVYLNNNNDASVYHPQDGLTNPIINWDPTSAMQVINMGQLGVQSPALGLLHELTHALYSWNEPMATAFETRIAITLDEPTRSDYNATGLYVDVNHPTQHTDEDGTWTILTFDGEEEKSTQYDGTTNAPNMGWAGTAGGGGGGGGGAGTGGGGGGVYLPPYTPEGPPKGGSVIIIPGSGEMPLDPFTENAFTIENAMPSMAYDASYVDSSNVLDSMDSLVGVVGVSEIY